MAARPTPASDPRLPTERAVPATWRTVAASLGSLLVLFGALNVLAGAYLAAHPEPNAAYDIVRRKWRRLLAQAAPVDGLVLGDSACNQGVLATVVAATLGGEAVNLCTAGSMLTVGDAWMLERYAARHGWPKYVVAVHVYDGWDRGPDPQLLAQVPLRWGYWREGAPPLRLGLRARLLVFLTRHVPAIARKDVLGQALRGRPPRRSAVLVEQPDGYMRCDVRAPRGVAADLAEHLRTVRGKRFAMSAPNRAGLRRLVRLAEEHGFDLYVANAPVHERLHADPGFRAYFAAVRREVAAITAGSRRAAYLPRAFVAPEPLLANSVDHLVHEGARSYSALLARELAARRAGRAAPAPADTTPADTTPARIGDASAEGQ